MTLQQLLDFLLPEERRSLGIFILISVALHLCGFFLFKSAVLYSKIAIISPPRVTLLTFTDPSGHASTWMDLLDPRHVAFPVPTFQSSTIKREGFDEILPTLELPAQNIPVSAEPISLPSALDDLAKRAAKSIVPSTTLPMPMVVETPPALSGTDISIQGALSKRNVIYKEPLPLARSSLTLLLPTLLRMAADSHGIVAYVLIDESCGDPEVDLLAVQALKNWRFAEIPAKNGLQWSKVVVFWDVQTTAAEIQTPHP
ncbi:MAG: hypothetical protein ACOY3I_03030 [Verrucomicrobiota bacterium]